MELAVQTFWVPKLGNAAEEYEDAAAISVETQRFAVSDGATESSFADRWAQGLVRRYTVSPPLTPPTSVPLQEWLTPLQEEWHASIHWDSLPWFAEEKARSGAFATLLGVYLVGGTTTAPRQSLWNRLLRRKPAHSGPRWHAMAVGDSCLFHLREGRLIHAFPLQSSAAFSDRPLLISSNPTSNHRVWSAVQFAEGDCLEGDMFCLGTDALAKWFLQEAEAGRQPWAVLEALNTQEDFAALVDRLRSEKTLKNDDTTLLRLTCLRLGEPSAGSERMDQKSRPAGG